MNITNDKLAELALQIEQSFRQQNIEKFVTEYTAIEDIEIMAISSCWLNIGVRNEGVAYAQWAFNKFKEAGGPLQYVLNKKQYWTRFQHNHQKFTTHHTLHDWWIFMCMLYKIYSVGSTILEEVKNRIDTTIERRDAVLMALMEIFGSLKQMPAASDYVPNKLVRFVSMLVRPRPICTGIWAETEPELFGKGEAYIPLNSELIKVIADNAIMESPNMTWDFAKSLINYFSNVFPDDPGRGYYSLIGLQNYK